MNGEIDRVRMLEDAQRRLWRHLEEEQDERRALAARVRHVEERLRQAESDVKDAHDRLDGLDRIETKREEPESVGPFESLDDVDERELGESGA